MESSLLNGRFGSLFVQLRLGSFIQVHAFRSKVDAIILLLCFFPVSIPAELFVIITMLSLLFPLCCQEQTEWVSNQSW